MQSEYRFGFSLVSAVHTCACLGELQLLRQVQGVGIVIGLEFGVVACKALVGDPNDGYLVFSGMREKDIVSWTSMVVGYARASRLEDIGQGSEVLGLFEQMMKEGIVPSADMYVRQLMTRRGLWENAALSWIDNYPDHQLWSTQNSSRQSQAMR
ncbi:hypothetical protein POM88_037528 [Heracleum sosnowskyi]|uniref:Pentatricopeptide repeat-containing protein n=1 Tax=Heracleum sosnowskyi TaxID=360622 RepID=A0AAD8HQM8_9APIA|nr:hypothetical protein POM88_037528 [Heracleum sosnowskyi]